ncbi:MAG: FKBP-type peptidyl-prolyl cis-trans isomerase [Bacteroidales bacterium]|jgi:FKBP-type peptidyl-prolyl cis-trans isomerase|nr:FKBP-type peptidyl-prolyl cis-trans isomerase [Bacteroidales bacterium]
MAKRPSCSPVRQVQPVFTALLAALWLSSCRPHNGYTLHEGIYYRLLEMGESNRPCLAGDYITANIAYMTLHDSVFFSGVRKFRISAPEFPGAIDHCFLLMKEKDSMQFIIPTGLFFGQTLKIPPPACLKNRPEMKIALRLLEVQTKAEYEKEKDVFLRWIKDFGEHERSLLLEYVRKKKMDATPSASGIYYMVRQKGHGPAVGEGRTVTLHYEGYFLDGQKFDSTKERGEPFRFIFGHEQQLIAGLEKVISQMRAGEKGLAVIPSGEAFGNGSAAVPPFTPVVYEIELTDVR